MTYSELCLPTNNNVLSHSDMIVFTVHITLLSKNNMYKTLQGVVLYSQVSSAIDTLTKTKLGYVRSSCKSIDNAAYIAWEWWLRAEREILLLYELERQGRKMLKASL